MATGIVEIANDLGFEVSEYLEVLDVFLENTPAVVENIRISLGKGSLLEAAEHCHLIKGGASSIGLSEISDISHKMEVACKLGNISAIPDLLKRLTHLLAEIEEQRKLVE